MAICGVCSSQKSGGWCVRVMTVYPSRSPCSILFVNFLYKRLREGKKTRASRQDGRGQCHHSIFTPLSISVPPKKAKWCPRPAHRQIKTRALKNPATCLCRVEVGRSAARLLLPQASRTLSGEVMLGPKRLVVNSVVKRK